MKPVVVLSSCDAEFCLLLQYILEAEGYAVCLASKPDQVVRLAHHAGTRAILLDCLSPDIAVICAGLKHDAAVKRVPIAALVGADSDHHIDLIEAGIDESLVRPLAPARLLQFLKAGAAGAVPCSADDQKVARLSRRQLEIEMNIASHDARCNGQHLELTPIGFRLLHHFVQFPETVHSRSALIAAAWRATKAVEPRTVDTHIARLRQALRDLCGYDAIRSVRSEGYRLDVRTYQATR